MATGKKTGIVTVCNQSVPEPGLLRPGSELVIVRASDRDPEKGPTVHSKTSDLVSKDGDPLPAEVVRQRRIGSVIEPTKIRTQIAR